MSRRIIIIITKGNKREKERERESGSSDGSMTELPWVLQRTRLLNENILLIPLLTT